MGKRGPKPKGAVKIRWSANFAYAIGLLATDGCLSKDGRHVDFTSKELEQLRNFKQCLELNVKIASKRSGRGDRWQFRIQFGDVLLYRFLLNIGFMPAKSKVIGALDIPPRYLFDFLRGHFDGDGSFHSYWDPRWKSSFMFYTTFVSASKTHIDWLRTMISDSLGIRGHITKSRNASVYQLKYAKADSLKLLRKLYYNNRVVCLSRKRVKVERALAAVGEKL
ncbi:MAG: hypothetical protein A2Z88_01395 [Omnitrophica WOR_2 bacterium GWA2_47_8]|nr:MAG: hypothetical protein A2Z88_01395 [Omnitrophica WOR_2 bacterium GWA2_47_8]